MKKKEDEKKKMEALHQQEAKQMIKSAEGSAGLHGEEEHRS